jgi:choline dehydrogenase-like flavoprotein
MTAADALLAAPPREPARHSNATRVVIYSLLIVFAIIYLLPLVVMVMTSLKPLDEVTGGNMFYLPQHLTFEPWTKAWGTACVGLTCAGLKGYVWNSVKMVVPAVLISTLLGALNGYPNVELRENVKVGRLVLDPDGKRLAGVEASVSGERKRILGRIVILSAGAVNSAALLLVSSDEGIANRSDAVGRHFMNHNCSAVLAIDPRTVNDSIYQKTLGINDFYLDDGQGGPPLGNIQLLGRVTAPILKSNIPRGPEWALSLLSRRAVDWYAMSEDLPNPESRVTVRGGQIHLDWKRSNWSAHEGLVRAFKERLRGAGYPIVLTKAFDRRTPSHQCGTVRIGRDPRTSPLDSFCRAWDHPNLFVVDASFLPTSAAVNPALTIAAQALRVADHIGKADLR